MITISGLSKEKRKGAPHNRRRAIAPDMKRRKRNAGHETRGTKRDGIIFGRIVAGKINAARITGRKDH